MSAFVSPTTALSGDFFRQLRDRGRFFITTPSVGEKRGRTKKTLTGGTCTLFLQCNRYMCARNHKRAHFSSVVPTPKKPGEERGQAAAGKSPLTACISSHHRRGGALRELPVHCTIGGHCEEVEANVIL